jgi:hypothetical protein
MKDLLDDVRLGDLGNKDGDVVVEPSDADGEVIDSFPVLEADFNTLS